MNAKRFGKRALRQASRSLRRGDLHLRDYEKVKFACGDPETLEKWYAEVKARKVNSSMYGGFSWAAVWDWVQANWPAILKILLTLLAFAEKPEDADSK